MEHVRRMNRAVFWLALCSLLCSACGIRYWVCDDVDPAALAQLPPVLSATGLFVGLAAETKADGVLAYRPEYELWSDGAQKRRWLWLPPGTRIDSSNMDAWSFPEGTRLWKEFVRDGVRVETRLLTKLGPRDEQWAAVSYVWRADQSDADLTVDAVSDVLGTAHDVPAAAQCMACHGGRQGRVLGVAALQLGLPAARDEVSLRELWQRGLLSHEPAVYTLPGDATQQAALGYLYANCAHCHNDTRPSHEGARCYDPRNELDFSLSVTELGALKQTAAYQAASADAWSAGKPEESELSSMMARRSSIRQMPPLASEVVDERGLAAIRAWIVHP